MISSRVKDVAGPEALAEFRRGLTAQYGHALIGEAGGGIVARLPVGVGKTEWLVRIAAAEASGDTFGVVVVLVPRRDILHELAARLPKRLGHTILLPRPRRRCGSLDEAWAGLERRGLGLLGRETLCGGCPARSACGWPDQFNRLRGQRLVLTTQQRLLNDPHFIRRVERGTGADRSLVLLDESNLLLRPKGTVITPVEFGMYLEAMDVLQGASGERARMLLRLAAEAGTPDLRGGRWPPHPMPTKMALAVQREGERKFGDAFRFLGHDLAAFARSDVASRERLPNGSLRFAAIPYLGDKFMVFTGSMQPLLARYRVDPDHAGPPVVSPFDDLRFSHPGTVWQNINALDGAAKFYPGNAERVIHFFANLTACNVRGGKKTLLVTRKKFAPMCRHLMQQALTREGVTAHVADGRENATYGPGAVVLITYGVAGLNRFEEFDAAFCLNSYYVTSKAVSDGVQDIEPSDARYAVRIEMSGRPRRRRAIVDVNDGSLPLVTIAAGQALEQLEADVVLQAVGRVRPFTRPREVITFQAGALPGVAYSREFLSFAEARAYYGVATPAASKRADDITEARRRKAAGQPSREIAEAIKVSPSTVKRYLRG